MKEIETEKEHSRLNKNWMEKISTGFICDMWTVFWVTAVCKRESVRVNRTTVHRDTIRHFVALVFIAAMKKLCEQQWKKNAYTHMESERRERVFITFFFFHLNWMRVYCDSLIPFLRGANTQQAQKKKKKKNNNNKSYTKRVYTDLMVRVRALVQWFCLLFLGILAVDVYRVSQSPWMEVNANERITQKKTVCNNNKNSSRNAYAPRLKAY